MTMALICYYVVRPKPELISRLVNERTAASDAMLKPRLFKGDEFSSATRGPKFFEDQVRTMFVKFLLANYPDDPLMKVLTNREPEIAVFNQWWILDRYDHCLNIQTCAERLGIPFSLSVGAADQRPAPPPPPPAHPDP